MEIIVIIHVLLTTFVCTVTFDFHCDNFTSCIVSVTCARTKIYNFLRLMQITRLPFLV